MDSGRSHTCACILTVYSCRSRIDFNPFWLLRVFVEKRSIGAFLQHPYRVRSERRGDFYNVFNHSSFSSLDDSGSLPPTTG